MTALGITPDDGATAPTFDVPFEAARIHPRRETQSASNRVTGLVFGHKYNATGDKKRRNDKRSPQFQVDPL